LGQTIEVYMKPNEILTDHFKDSLNGFTQHRFLKDCYLFRFQMNFNNIFISSA